MMDKSLSINPAKELSHVVLPELVPPVIMIFNLSLMAVFKKAITPGDTDFDSISFCTSTSCRNLRIAINSLSGAMGSI